ncbi:MAG TPA: acyl-CoA dehydrogenase family protein [Actinomycetota bacterium]|nr:acyl-CoA dehydrogenase family protein [Actinomycetota bacterium]
MKSPAEAFRSFAASEIVPRAESIDQTGDYPDEVIKGLGEAGFLGATISSDYGGMGMSELEFGRVSEEAGAVCSSTRGLLTVQGMVGHALERWGTPDQKKTWLPRLATGETIAAFCLTEEQAGSDARSVGASVDRHDHEVEVTGKKLWITFGQIAGLFLVIGQHDGHPTAVLVERDRPGSRTVPVTGQLGMRGAMLAELHLENCRLPVANLVGKPGFGFTHVAGAALDHGRHSVAWGCVGTARACLEASVGHATTRQQYGAPLADHQLIRRKLTEMFTGVKAARLLCESAARLRDSKDPGALSETMTAKYFASRMLAEVATEAVQVQGAAGIKGGSGVERFYRDAKVMQIIEGTDEMLQLTIADFAIRQQAT